MTTAIWLELKRSPLLWWLPFLFATDLAVLFGRNHSWIGVWPEASAAAQIAAGLYAPLLAAAAAWAAGRTLRTGINTEQLSSAAQPAWRVEFAQLVSTLTFGLGPLLIGFLIAAAASFSTAGSGFIWPSYVLVAIALGAIGVGVGHLLGRSVLSYLTAPLAAVLVQLLVMFGAKYGLILMVMRGTPSMVVAPGALVARLAFGAVALAVAILVGARIVGRARRQWLPYAAGVVLAVVAVAVPHAGPLQVPRTSDGSMVCTDTVPNVCLWPEHVKYLPELTVYAGRFADVSEFLHPPEIMYEEGLRSTTGGQGVVLSHGVWVAADSMAAIASSQSGIDGCPPPDGAPDYDTWWDARLGVSAWLAARIYGGPQPDGIGGGDPRANALVDEVLRLTPEEQAAWAREQLAVIHGRPC